MPQTVDFEKMKTQMTFDVSAPTNSPTGIPMKQIPVIEFPRVVYKHPTEPFRTVIHRNAKHEVVQEEIVPSEHLTMTVLDADALKAATKAGWVTKPYLPQTPPDPDANLYSQGEPHGRAS